MALYKLHITKTDGTQEEFNPIVDQKDVLPEQSGNTGKFLQTTGVGTQWTDAVKSVSLESGTGNGTVKLTVDGSSSDNIAVTGLGSLAYKSSLVASDIPSITKDKISDFPTKLPASDTVQTYSASGTAPISGAGVKQALDTITTTSIGAIPTSQKGANGGVAELDSTGKVPSGQLPAYVDDVLEFNSLSDFPATGETGKIYIAKDTNKTYRWSGTQYVEISPSLALGETSATAYRGDRGKTAYDHSTETKLSSATASGLYKVAGTSQGHISSLTAVTKADITGLGIPGSDTTYSAGSGLSLSGTTFNHSNSISAVLSAGLYKVKYDAQGHINGTTAISKADITGLGIPGSDTTYSAGSGLSLSGTTFNHSNSISAVLSAGLYKVKYDAQGHINGTTAISKADITGLGIPAQDTVTTATTSGSGNAVTSITASGGALTVKKDTTFLTSHQDISGKINVSGSRGTLAGYETSGTATTISESSADSNQVSSSVTVSNGSSGTSWTKIVRFTSAVTVTKGSSWVWANGEAPTIAAGGVMVCCWCGSGGIINYISPSA